MAADVNLHMMLESASEHSFSLKSVYSDIGIEKARLDSVRSDYYPTLAVSYNNEYNKGLGGMGVESVGDTVISNGTGYQTSLALNFSYELYHFGMTRRKVNAAEKEVAVKQLQWCEEEIKLHREILEHYAGALKADVSLAEQQKMLEIRRRIYEQKERLNAAGKYSKLDLGEEAIAILDLEHDAEESGLRYDNEIMTLEKLSHLKLIKNDTLQPLRPEADESRPKVLFERTAEGARVEEQLLQKHEEIIMLDRSRLPSIVFYGNYYFYGSDPTDVGNANESLRGSSWKAGVGIRWTIFEGFKFDSEMQRLKMERQKLENERDALKRRYDYERQMGHARIKHYEMLQTKEKGAISQTEQRVGMAKRLRDQSEIKSIDVLLLDLEHVKRRLTLETKTIESDYEKILLNMTNKGSDQCILR